MIDITNRENYYANFFDILYQNNLITKIRKDFYITYIKRNSEIMDEIVNDLLCIDYL